MTTFLASDPAPVTVAAFDGGYLAVFGWHPDRTPVFGSGIVETAYGLNPDARLGAVRSVHPSAGAASHGHRRGDPRASGFPADGLDRIRAAVTAVVAFYGIGGQVWSNDLLAAVETIPGTRVTALTVQHDSADVSGVDPPLDALWTVAAADLTIVVT